jgi:RNA polymerase sigma factor (sigma-70 family)
MDDFAGFFERTRHEVFRVVFAAVASRVGAEDAVAEAYARAYLRWPLVAVHPNPTAWVLRTALNLHRSSWRRLRREVLAHTPPELAPTPVSEGSWTDSPVGVAVLELPRRQREAVALRLIADLSVEQAASVLGLAPSTVNVHLSRALKRLRQKLDSSEGDRSGHATGPRRGGRVGGEAMEILELSLVRAVRHAL